MMEQYAIIILAAGSSSRMGTSKQLLTVDSKPLLRKTVETALGTGIKNIVVVLGANATQHEMIINDLPVDVIINPGWERGMGSSLKFGVNMIRKKTNDLKAFVVLVCDQPLLSPVVIKNLINQHTQTKKGIIASKYLTTAGVPALFEAKYSVDILKLKDEQGAKKIIEQNPQDLSLISFDGGEVDLDTKEDYDHFIAQNRTLRQ